MNKNIKLVFIFGLSDQNTMNQEAKDQVIQEVDEKLEGDPEMRRVPTGLSSLRGDLTITNRDVDKILSKMKHRHQAQSMEPQDKVAKTEQRAGPALIGKYNYYGKKYRFEEKEEELHIQAPEIQRPCRTEINEPTIIQKNDCSKTVYTPDLSNEAQASKKDFFGDGQIEYPTQKYYICFDDSIKKTKKPDGRKQPRQYIESTVAHKFKPAWVMEKKINSLQRQLNEMKEREKKMGATMHSVMLQSSVSSKQHRQTVDFPIHIKSNVERMVDSLWK